MASHRHLGGVFLSYYVATIVTVTVTVTAWQSVVKTWVGVPVHRLSILLRKPVGVIPDAHIAVH